MESPRCHEGRDERCSVSRLEKIRQYVDRRSANANTVVFTIREGSELVAVAEAARAHREADNTIQRVATQPHTSGGQDAFRDAIRAKVSAERALFAALDALESQP